MKNQEEDLTHFGFRKVTKSEKTSGVAEIFHSVASRYNLMNDLMSLGTHRIIKRMAANSTRARNGHFILDLAGGTGDLTLLLSKCVGQSGRVFLCDINSSMIQEGRDQLLNRGIVNNVNYVQADGERLPFHRESFDSVIIGFGLRNFSSKETALNEILACLKPQGRIVVLEFSKPRNNLVRQAYNQFAKIWPKLGKKITGDEASYRYLLESIQMHPDQENLRDMIETAGFYNVRYQNIFNGVVAIHEGIKA